MGRIVAIGDGVRVRGFGLAGCHVVPATDPEATRRAWANRGTDVDLVILTSAAAEVLAEELAEPNSPLVAVMPQ